MLPFASLPRTERRRPSGFTLIELLVVIAIISVLAAILFPVFAKARSRARETTALSNLKQIGAAMQMYAADYDEHLPNRWPLWPGYGEFYWRVEEWRTSHAHEVVCSNTGGLVQSRRPPAEPESEQFTVNGELAPGWPLSKIGRPRKRSTSPTAPICERLP